MKRPQSNHWRGGIGALSLILCLACGGLVSVWLKQDANWDLMNYHIYNPWALLHNRAEIDLFAAGIQTYFNPLLDIPYYYLAFVWLSDQPRAVAFLMGLPYGLVIFFALYTSRRVLSDLGVTPRAQPFLACLLVAFGATGAATLPQVGTTFNETHIAALILGGVAVLLSGLRGPDLETKHRRTILGGLLFGLAAGLKLTASIYAPAAVIALLLVAAPKRHAMTTVTAFCLAWAIGFCIAFGWWAFHLYNSTGNPMFPLFENVFHTSWLGSGNGIDSRFKPHSVLQAIFYPFYWIDTSSVTVAEPVFSDPRFSAALIAFFALIGARLFSKNGQANGPSGNAGVPSIPQSSLFVLTFVAMAYVTWLSLASKTRYPAWGRADFGPVVLDVQPVQLAPDSLVIVLGPPQAYALPSLAKQNPDVQFVGIDDALLGPRKADLWKKVMQKIDSFSGSRYAMVRLDALQRLNLMTELKFRIDEQACKNFSTNIDAGFRLCPISRDAL
ncbi:MAG: glycosyltransferase family 87 protein [Proteobacteria bacterium]|nr:glycosyltransferase family 87 protein [Pseudomonadota bacterium]